MAANASIRLSTISTSWGPGSMLRSVVSKIAQYPSTDLGLHPGGNLGEHVPESMNKTSLAQRFWVDLFDGRDQALGAVRDDQQRSGKAAFAQIGQEVGPRVGGLTGPR